VFYVYVKLTFRVVTTIWYLLQSPGGWSPGRFSGMQWLWGLLLPC